MAVLALTTRLFEAEPEWVGLDGCLLRHSEYCKLLMGRRWIQAANDLTDICVLVGGAWQTLWALLGSLLRWGYMRCTFEPKAVCRATVDSVGPDPSASPCSN